MEDLRQPLRGVGEVHDDRGTDVVGHRLQPAGRTGGDREAGGDGRGGHAQCPGGAGRGEGVADVDLATRPDPDRHAVETETTLLQADLELLGLCEREDAHRYLGGLEEPLAVQVVRVHDGPARVLRREELRFGREVGLHGPVIVEVVLAQVREDCHVMAVTVEPVLGERVGADFERRRCSPRVPRVRQRTLQVGCFGCGARPPQGSDHRCRPAVRLEHRAEEVGRRRLAVGAGHPDGSKRRRRVVPEHTRGKRHRGTRAGRPDDQLDCLRGLVLERVLAHERHRARPARRRSELMAVDAISGQAAVQSAGTCAAMVVCHRGDDEA